MAQRRPRMQKKNVIKTPWHEHGGGDKEIKKTEKFFIEAYKEQLQNLNNLLVNFYAQNASSGLLTYADIAANGQLQGLLAKIRDGVDESFRLRAQIIRTGLKAAADQAYTDILYQAEKIAYARAVARSKSNILPMEARMEPAFLQGVGDMFDNWYSGEGMNGIRPTEEALNALHAQSQAQLKARIRAALAGAGTDIRSWQKLLQEELSKDAGRFLRVLHTDANRVINEARNTALESNYLESVKEAIGINEDGFLEGTGLCMIWRHDEPRTARSWHIDLLDNTVPDYDGLWWSNHTGTWLSAAGPGQFGSDDEDNFCRCYLDLGDPQEARGMSTNHGVVPVPEDYAKRRKLG